MGGDRQTLNMDLGDLDDFKPKVTRQPLDTKRAVDTLSGFPSRDVSGEGQLNIKGNRAVLDRFKRLCKDDRRNYVDMLEILMDHFDTK